MLELRSVTKTYLHRGDTVVAMDRISLQIAAGEYLAVVGASGSGKSTLLLTLGGMLSPSAGEIWVGSQSFYALPSRQRALLRRKNIGFVFQSFNLVPYLNALENVQLPLFLAGADDAAQRSVATALLARVGLSDRLNHKPSELSVGQMQRVALARMLANDPPVILADEPTGNLDPQTADMVLDFLQELNREGRTIVMVTHDMRAAGRAGRLIRLVEGAVASDSAVLPCAATN